MPKRVQSESDEEYGNTNSPEERDDASLDEPSTSKGKKGSSKTRSSQPKSKKSRTEDHETTATTGNIKINAEGDKYIDLGKKRRAVVRSFKGTALLDIREYYGSEGEEKPGKKGISLQLEQWRNLRDASSVIDELFEKLKK